ncbi:uncharacterized protein F5891DRAFT_1244883 [Suillus fuscotomentosus]|uniref:Uncharacterized protein n=1 Tax=Suillus fuscotomentosus TaxID=1912939 RepID=A0AAD4E003_9AGAM|nr:uncharacterized protein F5891DRAFT_1244883 [Suillus fuscotomentosus]KAG1897035.1 hypothetical protein F5891DRAFT_1244883 [Suillus fuscotomentosus]
MPIDRETDEAEPHRCIVLDSYKEFNNISLPSNPFCYRLPPAPSTRDVRPRSGSFDDPSYFIAQPSLIPNYHVVDIVNMTRVPLLATPMSHGGNSVELTVLTFRHYCVPWTQWSAPIKIEDIGFIHLRVRLPDDDMDVVKADVVIDGSTIFRSLCLHDTMRMSFLTPLHLKISMLTPQDPKYGDTDMDQLVVRDRKSMLPINDASRTVDIMEIGVLVPFNFHGRKRTRAVPLDVAFALRDSNDLVIHAKHIKDDLPILQLIPSHKFVNDLPRYVIHATPSFHGQAVHPDLIPDYVTSLESQIMVLEVLSSSWQVILVVNMAIFATNATQSEIPVEIPWSEWGPKYTRYFPHHPSHRISVFGSKMAHALPQDRAPEPGQRLEELPVEGSFYVHIWDFNRAISRLEHSNNVYNCNSPGRLICRPGRLAQTCFTEDDADIITNHPYTTAVCPAGFSTRHFDWFFLEQDRLTLIWAHPGSVQIQVVSPSPIMPTSEVGLDVEQGQIAHSPELQQTIQVVSPSPIIMRPTRTQSKILLLFSPCLSSPLCVTKPHPPRTHRKHVRPNVRCSHRIP